MTSEKIVFDEASLKNACRELGFERRLAEQFGSQLAGPELTKEPCTVTVAMIPGNKPIAFAVHLDVLLRSHKGAEKAWKLRDQWVQGRSANFGVIAHLPIMSMEALDQQFRVAADMLEAANPIQESSWPKVGEAP